MLRPTPIHRENADDLVALTGRTIASVTYHVLALPDGAPPSEKPRYATSQPGLHGELEAIDLAFEDGGTATVTWAMAKSGEGLCLLENPPSSWHAYEALDASDHEHWRAILGRPITAVGAGWQRSDRSDADASETLWALRIEAGARAAVVALGDAEPPQLEYRPDEVVVMFDEAIARAYRPMHVQGSAWGARLT